MFYLASSTDFTRSNPFCHCVDHGRPIEVSAQSYITGINTRPRVPSLLGIMI